MPEDKLTDVAHQATSSPYTNPRTVTREDILTLLTQAQHGEPPAD